QHGIVNEQQYEYQTAECQCCIDGAEQVGGEAAEHRADHSAEPLHGADDTPRLGAAAFPYGAGEIFIPGWQHKAVGQTDETGDGEDQPDGFECAEADDTDSVYEETGAYSRHRQPGGIG